MISHVLDELKNSKYSPETVDFYDRIFKRLIDLADETGTEYYSAELAEAFIADTGYRNGTGYCHSRYLLHTRCIQFIDSYIRDGIVDLSVPHRSTIGIKQLSSLAFQDDLKAFTFSLKDDGLKPNTIDGYVRLVYYFLHFLEEKGYTDMTQVKAGDITFFLALSVPEHYAPTSIGSHLPGLRRFAHENDSLKAFEDEVPEHVPKKEPLTPVYTDEEIAKINGFLENSDISARNKAIALMAFDTGLRAVDICELKINDIDWKHDTLSIVQQKTGKAIRIPLRPELGNALAAYLLEERPASDSPYVFLTWSAPYRPFTDHAGIYNVLHSILDEAGIEPNGRISGTRMTRHNYASRLLRKGVPLTVISQALGHTTPNSTLRYLTTDQETMKTLTLPLPKGDMQ